MQLRGEPDPPLTPARARCTHARSPAPHGRVQVSRNVRLNDVAVRVTSESIDTVAPRGCESSIPSHPAFIAATCTWRAAAAAHLAATTVDLSQQRSAP